MSPIKKPRYLRELLIRLLFLFIIFNFELRGRIANCFELIAARFTNKEIGQILHQSAFTGKGHEHNILEKIALHKRLQIVKNSNFNKEFKEASDPLHNQKNN